MAEHLAAVPENAMFFKKVNLVAAQWRYFKYARFIEVSK